MVKFATDEMRTGDEKDERPGGSRYKYRQARESNGREEEEKKDEEEEAKKKKARRSDSESDVVTCAVSLDRRIM